MNNRPGIWAAVVAAVTATAALGYAAIGSATGDDEVDPAKSETLDKGPQPATPTPQIPHPSSASEEDAIAQLGALGAPGEVAVAAAAGDLDWLLEHTARSDLACTRAGATRGNTISCAESGIANGTVLPTINFGDTLDFYVTEDYVRNFLAAGLEGGNAPLVFAGHNESIAYIAFAPGQAVRLEGWDFDLAGVAFTTEFSGETPIVQIRALAPYFGPQQMFQRDFPDPGRTVIYNDEERSPGLKGEVPPPPPPPRERP